jgi:hypothetical protein
VAGTLSLLAVNAGVPVAGAAIGITATTPLAMFLSLTIVMSWLMAGVPYLVKKTGFL